MSATRDSRRLRGPALALGVLTLACACGGETTGAALPAGAELEGMYGSAVGVALNGNVVDVRVRQEADQLRRGGELWAKVGPYIYLFSPQTKQLFDTYAGVGGVRVRTYDPGGNLVASALLERGTLNSLTWKRALQLVRRARLEGTERPSYMIDLVEYGEDQTRHEYSRRYVSPG